MLERGFIPLTKNTLGGRFHIGYQSPKMLDTGLAGNLAGSVYESPESRQSKKRNTEEKIATLLKRLPILGEMFHLHEKIGEGTFSCVYLATVKPCYVDRIAASSFVNSSPVDMSKDVDHLKERQFAVKHLIPTCQPSRVVRELKCLVDIGGVDNVAGITMCLRNQDCITFIMPYQKHDRFSSYVTDMTVDEVRLYMKQLLIAIKRVHQFGVIHRDVKPSNFLYSRSERKFLLVDFGLAQRISELSCENGENKTDSRKRKRVDDDVTGSEGVNSCSNKRLALQSLDSNAPTGVPPSPKKSPLKEMNRMALSDKSNLSFVKPTYVTKLSDRGFVKPQAFAPSCSCDRRPQICNGCLVRKGVQSPRAGTPGFRPPEVLLKYPLQTTAVDIWAVGVIMLCILSRTYPFFKSPDDVTALAEMITMFGSQEINTLARKLGRNVLCSEVRKPVNLKHVCRMLAERKAPKAEKFPDSAFDLLGRFLELDPAKRITAHEALHHPFLVSNGA